MMPDGTFELRPSMEPDSLGAPAPPASAAAALDRIIHERSRLALLAHLAVGGSTTFLKLRGLLNLSDGNLSSHLRVLEEASLVRVNKGYSGRRPQTLVELTELGKREFARYLDQLESVIRSARSGLGG